ncbi:hypothetical protein NQ315_016619 [Exocentrus adspersus]|uniref:Uncharacterized protein n=1 Tax=Exocentrus adspersus TaxID=1586481 RepID=A0AAV8VNX8_9CUCU|nr:hypothetical protein NQ315_016619 [Exocentrus adspersus]
MAKLQIFVLVAALSQVYGNVVISTLPAYLEVSSELLPESIPFPIAPEVLPEAVPLPTAPEFATPPCVASVRAILEAILARLPEISAPGPLPIPVDPVVPELEVVPTPEVENEPETPVTITPCSACFEHINSLLTSAEKVLAVRKMSQMLRF